MRRVQRLNPKSVPDGQGELFTHSPLATLQARRPIAATRSSSRLSQTWISAPCPSTLGFVAARHCLARAGRDRVQPHPRRRDHRVGISRQGNHSDHPPAVDRGPGPLGQLGTATGHPPVQGLAPGRTAGKGSSTRPADRQTQRTPEHPAPIGPTGGRQWYSGPDRRQPHGVIANTR